MGYKEQFEKAKKAKMADKINPVFKKFEKVDDTIVGMFMAKSSVGSNKDEDGQTYNQYLFSTDEGPVKFHLGSVADGEIGAQLVEGNVYAVIYKGKEKISSTRSVNKFECYLVPDMPEDDKSGKKNG